MYKYTFGNGEVVTSKLEKRELIKRMERLDILRVLTEGYTEGIGVSICKKALKAYDKMNSFTGIIRLNPLEKDFLGYLLDGTITKEEEETINFYIK